MIKLITGFLFILLISCNGQEENTNDFEIEDPIILCDDLTGNEYQYSREDSKWIIVDSISVEQANKMDWKNAIVVGKIKAKAVGTGKTKVIIQFPKKKSPFSIEYYPITKRYFPKYGNDYLVLDPITGIVNAVYPDIWHRANSFFTEQEAEQLINLFKEQQLKENVITIPK